MSLPAIGAARSVPFAIPTSEAAQARTSRSSMSKLYRQYCTEEGCRVNSAFLQYILDRGDTCAITSLTLRDNYLGPKGLRTVVRLIGDCQTLLEVDLSGNGADNTTVELLAGIAEQHLSLTSISLRNSPITVLGGKRIIDMLEANPRITMVDVAGSDILSAMQQRIFFAADLNRLRAQQSTPQLVAATAYAELSKQNRWVRKEEAKSRHAACEARHSPATLQPLAASNSTAAVAASPRPSAAVTAVMPAHPVRGSTGEVVAANSFHRPSPPPVSVPQQPPHAHTERSLASMGVGAARLPAAQLNALRSAYTERMRLFEEINGSSASKAAYAARAELMALEACSASSEAGTMITEAFHRGEQQPQQSSQPHTAHVLPRPAGAEEEGLEHGHARCGVDAADSAVQQSTADEEAPLPVSTSSPRAHTSASSTTSSRLASGTVHCPVTASDESRAGGLAPTVDLHPDADREGEPAEKPSGGPQPPPRRYVINANSTTPDPSTAMVLVSTEERFQLLFDEGCRAYSHQRLDDAYVAWSSALDIATERRNREWIAVVSANLQRLSYELLVNEGVQQLERNELEEAARSFTFAMEVAVKARNAAWESAMQKSLRKVQSAVFHRGHEAATALFRKASIHRERQTTARTTVVTLEKEDVEEKQDVIDADCPPVEYCPRGSNLRRRHTQAFMEEWPSMLHIRDAILTWGECVRVAARIGGSEGAELHRVVEDALTDVAAFLARHHFDTEVDVSGLGWQGTSRYHYDECLQLAGLWYELLAHVDQTLKHPLLGAIVSLHLGNLYLATNQLPLAGQQFLQVVHTSGKVLADPLLEAAGAMFHAILCWQRAMYAEAESQLLFAIRKCGEDATALAATAGEGSIGVERTATATKQDRQDESVEGNAVRSSGCGPLPRASVPAGFRQVIQTNCHMLLVRTLVRTYRHREALERLEHGLTYQYCDTLSDKLRATYFSGDLTSLDEIAAISDQVRSTLVYYFPARRYQWNDEINAFELEESLYTWVVPRSSEMRFVEVNVTKDFQTTLGALLKRARTGLHVEPDLITMEDEENNSIVEWSGHGEEPYDVQDHYTSSNGGAAGEIITTLHRHAWMQPLQTLYAILMSPIEDFIQAMSPLQNVSSSLVTVVPTGLTWAVPYHALMAPRTEKFLVESIAVQLCFSATQAAFAGLSAQRVVQRDLHRDAVVVPSDELATELATGLSLAFPLDAYRAQAEGNEVMKILRSVKDARARAAVQANPGATITARSETLVQDLQRLEELLPRARTVHFATTATASPPLGKGIYHHPDTMSGAAMCVPSSHEAVGRLSAREVSLMELFAELVVMTNTNVALPYVRRFSTQDHALNLIRSFLSGGVPCVLAGLWCTPDMKPSVLFTRFYQLLHTRGSGRVSARKSVPTEGYPGSVTSSTFLGTVTNTWTGEAAGTGAASVGSEVSGEGGHHKAVCLASAIRELLREDPSLRYAPRQWAGYYCVGCDYL